MKPMGLIDTALSFTNREDALRWFKDYAHHMARLHGRNVHDMEVTLQEAMMMLAACRGPEELGQIRSLFAEDDGG